MNYIGYIINEGGNIVSCEGDSFDGVLTALRKKDEKVRLPWLVRSWKRFRELVDEGTFQNYCKLLDQGGIDHKRCFCVTLLRVDDDTDRRVHLHIYSVEEAVLKGIP